MKVELISNWDDLEAISDQWNDLLSRSWADTIYLRWEWVSAWKDVFADQVRPFVVTVRDDDQIIGLAPFYKVEYTFCNILKYRMLRIIADSASGSEYPAWIISNKHNTSEIYDSIIDKLDSCAGEWDCMWMQGVRVWGGQTKYISRSVKKKYFINSRKNNSSAVSLVDCNGDYIKTLSRNMRSQLRRDVKKVHTIGEVCVKKCVDEQDIDTYLNALFKLHDIRWQRKGLKGMFERCPEEVNFYRNFVPVALRNGWLCMYALFQDDTIKAVQLGYIYHNIYNQLQEGFDPVCSSGAGNTLRLHVIEQCIREGIAEYDFLGEHTEHKRRWGGRVRAGYDLFIGRKSFKNWMLFKGPVWPTGRFLKPGTKYD